MPDFQTMYHCLEDMLHWYHDQSVTAVDVSLGVHFHKYNAR
jgi:hypothetical protein